MTEVTEEKPVTKRKTGYTKASKVMVNQAFKLLQAGLGPEEVIERTGVSPATISRLRGRVDAEKFGATKERAENSTRTAIISFSEEELTIEEAIDMVTSTLQGLKALKVDKVSISAEIESV